MSTQPATEPSDEELMTRLSDGDRSALDTLYRRHCARVRAYLATFDGCRELADDAAQDVFVQILRHAGSYKPPHQFWPWLRRVAHNCLITLVRRRTRRHEIPVDSDNADGQATPLDFPSGDPSHAEVLERQQLQELVRQCMKDLKLPYRIVIEDELHEVRREETAEKLGINEKSVDVYRLRARSALRDCIAQLTRRI